MPWHHRSPTKTGERVTASGAVLLSKLGIRPFEYKMEARMAWPGNGLLIGKSHGFNYSFQLYSHYIPLYSNYIPIIFP